MGWSEHHARQEALDQVVQRGLAVPPGFRDRDEVLLALHHRWSLRLTGRVELALLDAESDDTDRVDAVGAAWRETADDDPALRRLLDEHATHPALRGPTAAEHRLLARAAGLAEDAEDPAEQAAVGAALVALVRSGPRPPARRNPVERLLRRLVPSA